MEDIQQRGIAVHDHGLENPEEPLLLEERTNVVDVAGVQTSRCEILDCPEDRPNGDQNAAAE